MEEINKTPANIEVETLASEVKKFANSLPTWAKYLAQKVLSNIEISDEDINTSISFLQEELKLIKETEKIEINITSGASSAKDYKSDLLLSKIENVEGVNALTENQEIQFCENLTIVYGVNGSGKSGYIRLLKKVFYSKAPEEILPNIHLESGHKPINADFTFLSNGAEINLGYSEREKAEFRQFAVFDGKSVLSHLEQKNEFEFRPAGLSFFATFTEVVKRVEQQFNSEIQAKNSENEFAMWFEGESEIKNLVQNLSASTKTEDLKKFTPYSEEDKIEKSKIEKQYDEILLASKDKEKKLKDLENIKKLLGENKTQIDNLNKYFTVESFAKIEGLIADCLKKEAIAKAEGIENFKTDKIEGIGSKEWKSFIQAAEVFAKKQKDEYETYPIEGDNCILCHQTLSPEAEKLISNYWIFIKSVAEENAKKCQEELDRVRDVFEKLNFELFPSDNILTAWLSENHAETLKLLVGNLLELKKNNNKILSSIKNKVYENQSENKIDINQHLTIITKIEASIELFQKDEQSKELEALFKSKKFLEHKEKFNSHLTKFEKYIENQVWIKKANKADYAKRKITDTEKSLSNKYFNQKYVDAFNDECQKLNGSFGVDINHTGAAGKSYRQLRLKGRNPNAVLSEGEQKVIAIADFIAEMQLSSVNRGIIFDDPVTSLDETRKSEIAKRLVQESAGKQTIIFTHDLVFVSSLISHCKELKTAHNCHWVENRDGKAGQIWLNNSPSYEREYRNSDPAKAHYSKANKEDCPPMEREALLRSGFTALRTCYEVLVINDLFKNVVQRFNERVSVDSLSTVYFDEELIAELQDSFAQCCRYMEGHTHSDKYAYKKPDPKSLNEKIQRYDTIKSKLKKAKKPTV